MKSIPSHKQTGSTLIVVMSILATLMVIVGVAVEYTSNITRNVQRSSTLGSAIAVGDSCLDILFANWRTTCRTNPTVALATSSFSSIAMPTSATFPTLAALPNFTFAATATDYYTSGTPNPPAISNFKVVAANAEWQALASSSATPEPLMGQVDHSVTSSEWTGGANKTTPAVFNYVASADITLPTLKGSVVAKVRRVFQKQQLSPWNFAIFYVDPLEIHPGPSFTVTGWVHTNSDLYTGHSSLAFADKVTYGSDWFTWSAANPSKAFMPGDTYHLPNDPANGKPTYLSNLPPARDNALQPFGMDSTSIFNSADANPNNDSYHELVEPPTTGYTDAMSGTRYWDQASVAIRINADNSYTIGIPNSDGTLTSIAPPSSGPDPRTGGQKNLYNMFSGAIIPGTSTSNGLIQDGREAAQIRLATLDISQILSSTNPPTYKAGGFNGILYMYDVSNTPSTRRGIRIKNGASIPSTGLTIASNNPVYIQGDFNTGATGPTVPSNSPSNLNANDGTYINPANPPNSYVNGYTRAPCSIVADSINILSNSWSDANSATKPNASPTTINTAVIAGIVPTNVYGDGAYSGGAENFPRFLENWTNDTLTYYGSMVELFKSAQSIGKWGKPGVYDPPTREWYFDTNFKTKPPPGSIMIYSYIKGKWSVI
jgi:hypothetical protein